MQALKATSTISFRFPFLLVWVLLALLLSDRVSAITAPGTVISNQAVLTYQNSDNGAMVDVVSNVSTLSVSRYFNSTILSRHNIIVEAGQQVSFSHQLSNNGNVPDDYWFDVSAGGGVDDIYIVADVNRNGIADPGEPIVTGPVSLAPGQTTDIVIAASVLNSVQPGEVLDVSVTAIPGGGDANEVINTIKVGTGIVLSILKSVGPGCHTSLFPGDTVTHEIDLVTSGTSAASIRLLLNGEIVSGAVVEQELPAELLFSHFEETAFDGVGQPVVRLVGVAENSWLTVSAWDGSSEVKSVGMLYLDESLAPGVSDHFKIVTTVAGTVEGPVLRSTVAVADINGDRAADFASNSTCHFFSGPSEANTVLAELRFLEPSPAIRNQGEIAEFQSQTDFVTATQYTLSTEADSGYRTADEGVYLELTVSDDLSESNNIRYDRNGQRFIEARLESSVTGDHVLVLLLETATPGVFRSVAPVMLTDGHRSDGSYCPAQPTATTVLTPVYTQDTPACILASGSADQLQATYLDTGMGFAIAEASLVNPLALVFNAQTGLPVAGAKVSFRFAATELPVTHRATGLPYVVMTDANGLYVMPRLDPFNRYYVDVEPPTGHVFPSSVSANELPTYNVGHSSYGKDGFTRDGDGSFAVETGQEILPIDIPLDSSVTDALLIAEKSALALEGEVGGVVTYNIAVKNRDTRPLASVVLADRPPYGYRYVPLSSSVDGETIADPTIGDTGELKYELGLLEAGQTRMVSYSLRLSAAAIDSNGVNEVVAIAVTGDNAEVRSPVSRAQTRVKRRGVLSDRAALFGKIYVDQNCNAVQDSAEWPVGGVKLYLQDGTYTVSDADGSYSLYGLAPGRHVLKLDDHTLPDNLQFKPTDTHQAADPYSRFVDLMPGDFYRADFAAVCPQGSVEQLFREIKARNETLNGNWLLKEAERFRANEELPDSDSFDRVKSIDGDLSNGVIHGPVTEEDGSVPESLPQEVMRRIVASQAPAVEPLPDPKKLVSEITMAQAKAGTWIWPTNEVSARGRFMAVVRDGIEPTLYVNGQAVPSNHIGERLANRRERAQIVAWYGVELEPGENTVEVKGTGPFGNERILASGTFKKPSSGAAIKLVAAEESIQADGGRSTMPIKIQILDQLGYPALGVYFVTLESSDGGWLEQDIQSSEPGVQVRVSNGERTVHFISSSTTGAVRMEASAGSFTDEIVIQQISESRPLVAVGLVDAGISFSSGQYGDFTPSHPLMELDSGARMDGRVALFAKGRIRERFNLTLSYDSEKSGDTLLMRDINPAAHYPVHGDASIRGYDAQSRSKLYVKIEEDKNSLMWGDFLTDSGADHEDLARTRRALTGFNSVIDSEYGRFRFFASRQEDNHLTEEVPGNGSAMLYRLDNYPIVPNSEVVELITRSRDNPGVVIARTRLNRFGDYTIDPVLGYLTFSSVVPTVDDQQNPVFVQIAYDVESNGETYWVNGLRYDRTLSDNLRLGFSHTNDDNSLTGNRLSGAYATVVAGEKTQVKLSVASSTSIQGGNGKANRLSVDHQWNDHARTTLNYARAEEGFSNSAASIASGRVETRLNHKQQLSRKTSLNLDALHSGSLVSDESRSTLGAVLESRLRNWLVRAGLRQVTQQNISRKDDYITAILGLDRQIVLGDRTGQISADLEQDTGRASRRRIQVGAKINVHEQVRVYSNYELSNSLLALAGASSDQTTEVLTLGVESDLLPQTRFYSEYRMRGAFDNRDFETASGIRADYEIDENLKVSPNLEVIRGTGQTDSVAASVAVTDTRNDNSRRMVRLETRRTDFSKYLGIKASYAARVNNDWTSVITETLSRQINDTGENSLRHSFVAGFSRRPKLNNRHHMLMMYNWKEEEGVLPGLRRSVHLLSTHQNLQLGNRYLLTGRFGGKHQKTRLRNDINSDFTLLADVRLNFDLDRRVNIDLHGGVLTTNGMSEARYSAGAGVYYVLNKNARIGVGYNFGGFTDSDLDAEEYHAHGLRFGLQYKFDEDSLKWLQ